MFRKTLLAGALLCALTDVAPALDFHPLESRVLAGGAYSFDNFIIPEGVAVTLAGEPRTLDLVVNDTLRIDGELRFDPSWSVSFRSLSGAVIWDGEEAVPRGGALSSPPRYILSGVPEAATWMMLLVGLGLVYLVAARDMHTRDRQRDLRTPTFLADRDRAEKKRGER